MKNTPLTEKHLDLGAKMAEFAGYNMPISYSGIREEHEAVRTRAGMFDVSHMGEFVIKGRQALELVQHVTSNDVSKLRIGQAQYSCLPNANGGIVDDLLVYRLPETGCNPGDQAFMLVVNASNIEKDWNWILQHNTFDTRMIDISEETGLIALQGPRAIDVLQPFTNMVLKDIPYYHFAKGMVAGEENVLVSATGYTGAGGFEIYALNDSIVRIWDVLFKAGSAVGLLPVGLGARDTLRLEMGFCLYGNDIDDTHSPLEAGLGWITRFDKGPFVGRDWILKQKQEGVRRKLAGFVVDDRRVPRHGYRVLDRDGNAIGEVTSGTQSPSLNVPIGLAYVPPALSVPGSALRIDTGSKTLPAKVVKLPFYHAD